MLRAVVAVVVVVVVVLLVVILVVVMIGCAAAVVDGADRAQAMQMQRLIYFSISCLLCSRQDHTDTHTKGNATAYCSRTPSADGPARQVHGC